MCQKVAIAGEVTHDRAFRVVYIDATAQGKRTVILTARTTQACRLIFTLEHPECEILSVRPVERLG